MSYTPVEDRFMAVAHHMTEALIDRPELCDPKRQQRTTGRRGERSEEAAVPAAMAAALGFVRRDRERLPDASERATCEALDRALAAGAR